MTDTEKIEQLLVKVAELSVDISYIKSNINSCSNFANRISDLENTNKTIGKVLGGAWVVIGGIITTILVKWIT